MGGGLLHKVSPRSSPVDLGAGIKVADLAQGYAELCSP